ncbi:hypothetical protein OG866_01000 [Streptomyces sp. NBC_00663]|uniref:hypothetical protein n=1 Tax=Streptomyces sp. NBC_00663 TaxID=2975801 RepID=UPI002E363E67|nr:hypothetical protein [Streptomyces sp. NBC_00663]
MDCTQTAGQRLFRNGAAALPCAERAGKRRAHSPIYDRLVTEWRAMGRFVPEHHDAPRASFAAPTPEGDAASSSTSWMSGWCASPYPPTDAEASQERRSEQARLVPAAIVPGALSGL